MLINYRNLNFTSNNYSNPKLLEKPNVTLNNYFTSKSISFGCRMLAFFSKPCEQTDIEKAQVNFRKELLNDADNSFKKQSKEGREFSDGINKIHS